MVDYVSGSSYTNNGSSTSIPIPGFSVSTGNLLVVGMRWEGGGATDTATASLADTAGNTYTLLGYQSTGSGEGHRIAVFYCLSAVGNASNAITVTISASRTYRQAYAAQYSYSGTLQLGDTGSGANGGDTTTVTSSPALTAKSGDVVVGVNSQFHTSFTFTPNAGYTARDALALLALFDNIPSGSFNEAPGGTYSSTGDSYVILTAVFEAAANSAPTGRADETDTALGLTRRKAKAAQLATETDTALALTAAHARATGLASETDSALALAKLKAKATGLASETETALALVRVKAKPVGLATETDNALAVSAVKTRSTGRADETDTALAPGAPLGVGIAGETDSAFALACLKSKVAQVATTTETALALTARKIRECGTATETDAALNLTPLKVGACGRADETDAAFACPPFGVIARPVGLAVEMDEALALAALVLSEAELPRGGDDVPDRGHRGWDRKRSRLKLRREREFTEQIRDLYRELTGDPRTAERAEAILAPVVAAIPAGGESEAAREAAIEARADALRARADAFEANALQAEIALRLLHRELRDWQEADDLQAIRPLLAQVL